MDCFYIGRLRGVKGEVWQILVVGTEPWGYDPDVGAKATLILEVLNALTAELERHGGVPEGIEGALKKLARRVNWVKALKLAARSSITLDGCVPGCGRALHPPTVSPIRSTTSTRFC